MSFSVRGEKKKKNTRKRITKLAAKENVNAVSIPHTAWS